MENLIPHDRNIKKVGEMLDGIESALNEKKKTHELLYELIIQIENDRQMLRECMHQLYIETRKGQFYKKRIFVEKYYKRNGQVDFLEEWVKKWTYVIDNMALIYKAAAKNNTKLAVDNVMKVLLVWYQNEKRRKITLEDGLRRELKETINCFLEEKGKRVKDELNKKVEQVLKKYADKEDIETSSYKAVADECMKWASNLAEYRKHEFGAESENDYFFVIKLAFEELERIYEEAIENVGSLMESEKREGKQADRKQKFEKQHTEDILPCLLECIEIINPHIDRLCIVHAESASKKD